jgi:hypothetical protein
MVPSLAEALMAAEPLDIRMARLEGAYVQINERLAGLENRLATEMAGMRAELRTELSELRRQMTSQFYWVLTMVFGSILIPLLRDLIR